MKFHYLEAFLHYVLMEFRSVDCKKNNGMLMFA
jgi:hypothetical protein